MPSKSTCLMMLVIPSDTLSDSENSSNFLCKFFIVDIMYKRVLMVQIVYPCLFRATLCLMSNDRLNFSTLLIVESD